MTPSKRAKELGCKSLAQVVKATGQSEQTLINWFKTRNVVFDACCEYVARRNGKIKEADLVECSRCKQRFADFTQEAEFIGWHGHCVSCDMERDGESDDA